MVDDFVVRNMNKMLRAGVAVLSTSLLITIVGYGTAAAEGKQSHQGSIKGDGSSFGSFKFQARNDSNDPFKAKGRFKGISPAGPIFTLEGPITCLSIDGDKAGFIYQVENAGPLPAGGFMEVKVTIEEGRGGNPDRIGFDFAAPAGSHSDCDPGSASQDVKDGSVEVNGAG